MERFQCAVRARARGSRGQGATEYAMLLGLIAVIAVISTGVIGTKLTATFSCLTNSLSRDGSGCVSYSAPAAPTSPNTSPVPQFPGTFTTFTAGLTADSGACAMAA